MGDVRYFIHTDDGNSGPYTLAELIAERVEPDTWVWCKGMDDWKQAREVADICRAMRQHLYDISHPTPTVVQDPIQNQPEDNPHIVLPDQPVRFNRFSRYIDESELPDPTAPDYNLAQSPVVWTWVIVISIFLMLPFGIAALYLRSKSRKTWAAATDDDTRTRSHDYARRANMVAGIGACLGVCLLSFLFFKT